MSSATTLHEDLERWRSRYAPRNERDGYTQREIADAAHALQQDYDSRRRILVGVNGYTEGDDGEIEILRNDPDREPKQIDRIQSVRARRNATAVETALTRIREVAATDANLMPALLDAARAQPSEGEIVESLQQVWGAYTETPVF